MKEKIDILIKLQAIETEMDAVRARLSKIPKQLETLDARLSESEKTLEDQAARLDELRKTYRSQDSDLQMNLAKEKKNQEKLPTIKNNKEYQALLKGIDELKVRRSQIEDEMLGCLDQIEAMEAEAENRNGSFLKEKKQITGEKKQILRAEADEKERLEGLERKWQSVLESADPELLKTFTRIRDMAGGLAMTSVTDGICNGCNLNIPPQLYNDLRHFDSLRFCPHCHRIIYREEMLVKEEI